MSMNTVKKINAGKENPGSIVLLKDENLITKEHERLGEKPCSFNMLETQPKGVKQ